MSIMNCTFNCKPGVKFGKNGKCYTYIAGNYESRQRAIGKANTQGRAIKIKEKP